MPEEKSTIQLAYGDFIFNPAKNNEIRHLKLMRISSKLLTMKRVIIQIFITEEICYNENKVVDTREMNTNRDYKVDTSMGRFRKFTPRECLRLMGFDDNFKIVVSDTVSYKQAGNSIIVNVLMALLKQLDITKYGI